MTSGSPIEPGACVLARCDGEHAAAAALLPAPPRATERSRGAQESWASAAGA